ncbi:helix-turn-helix transcriptional regulator [Acetobacter sp. DmW_125133]|uniref:XRE family transcriptional regulator n=3 Tax=Acetobacteraceae TaxID=433 RepID=A0AAN1U824_9PROT|nr:transcriptional regulator [Acetobacter oryzifermentans]AXM99390.1 XRE family transcriptional regulator [Acetobacter pomorum]KAA8394036.1 helix-turn-helix transcriptional regulator [Acetobacter sp. DmW_125128]KAA8394745.1 helix-turn-helix transcriptional regulator [Acetobacter sp. DmW_125124]KAA8400888.1 helix-turn-helix transcriptional regulator [Acetobacter sp. DmW_125127]KAA8406811.1 helix-turn-helix transcriptional regulator [Acetobacter sp. DmW_125132]KAA8407574.1 helix-turn-helix tran
MLRNQTLGCHHAQPCPHPASSYSVVRAVSYRHMRKHVPMAAQIDIEQLLGTYAPPPQVEAPKRIRNDKHMGFRIRQRRHELCMSLEQLGHAIGCTYQQMQKYETGKNAIKATLLPTFATALDVPLTWFFEGLEA